MKGNSLDYEVLIISDSHGHIANLKLILSIARKGQISAIIHAGDWDNVKSVEVLLSGEIPLYSVLGNADINPEICKRLKVKGKRFGENFLIVKLDGKKIGITHKPSDNKKYFENKKLDLIINGHLHSKSESEWNGIKVIRPGAVKNGINFAVFGTKTNKVEFVEDDQN